jgi:hypothetical protein
MMSMLSPQDAARVVLIGVGATAVMDLVVLLLQRLGVPAPDWSFVGRWIGHFARGRFAHAAIARAAPIAHERGLGWLTHYAVGIAYAGLLVAMLGLDWAREPSLLPALLTGLATVVVPLFVMQPAMGNGFAAAKTPAPLKTCLRSLANHAAFGMGLYVAAALLKWLTR